eukprot:8710010-Karenia_brevis.AAC.1
MMGIRAQPGLARANGRGDPIPPHSRSATKRSAQTPPLPTQNGKRSGAETTYFMMGTRAQPGLARA